MKKTTKTTKPTAAFYTRRAAKIAAARARNEKKGVSVREQRVIAYANRTFNKHFTSAAAAVRFVQNEVNTVGDDQRICGLVFHAK